MIRAYGSVSKLKIKWYLIKKRRGVASIGIIVTDFNPFEKEVEVTMRTVGSTHISTTHSDMYYADTLAKINLFSNIFPMRYYKIFRVYLPPGKPKAGE